MKRIMMIVLAAVLTTAATFADMPIAANQLPSEAQGFISSTFPKAAIQGAVQDDWNEFEVYLSDGTMIEFRGGAWTSVKSQSGGASVVLPAAANSWIAANQAGATVYEVDKNWNGFEVKLSNFIEVYFDANGNFLGQKWDD